MKNFSLISKTLTVLFLVVFGCTACSGCSGGSALPQASIPAPADDCGESGSSACVTISSPDSEGFVTITAADGAVPELAVVEIRVGGDLALGESSLGDSPLGGSPFLHIFNSLCPSAYASECSSDLPECSADGATEDCSTTADDTGSFIVKIAAEIDESISITYFDPDTCDESEAFESVVPEGFLTLGFEGIALADNGKDKVYVFGTDPNEEASNRLGIFSITDTGLSQSEDVGEIVFSNDDNEAFNGTPLSITAIPGTDQVILITSEGVVIVDLTNYLLDGSDPVYESIVAEDGSPISVTKALVQENYEFSESCTALDAEPTVSYVRIFMARSDSALAEDTTDLKPLRIASIPMADIGSGSETYFSSTISYSSPSNITLLDGEDVSISSVLSVTDLFLNLATDKGYFTGKLDTSIGERHYLLSIALDDDLCPTSENPPEYSAYELTDMEGPGDTFWYGFGISGSSDQVVLIPDASQNSFTAVDLEGGEEVDHVSSILSEEVSKLDPTHMSSLTKIIPYTFVTDSTFEDETTPVNFAAIGNTPYLALFDMALSDTSYLLAEQESEIVVGINPLDMILVMQHRSDFVDGVISSADDFQESFEEDSFFVVLSEGTDTDGGTSQLKKINLSALSE